MAIAYIRQVLIGIDQTFNAILGGWADETLSSRAHREGIAWLEALINAIFFDNHHCRDAYRGEVARRQLPPEFRV